MYADIRPKSDLWLLRHESTFSSLTINGAPITPHFSSGNTTQIHAQTFEQRSRGISGPQVSLSEGMPGWMPTGCSCQVDVVGVPTTQTMQNLQYMGRIRLPNLEFIGNRLFCGGDAWAILVCRRWSNRARSLGKLVLPHLHGYKYQSTALCQSSFADFRQLWLPRKNWVFCVW